MSSASNAVAKDGGAGSPQSPGGSERSVAARETDGSAEIGGHGRGDGHRRRRLRRNLPRRAERQGFMSAAPMLKAAWRNVGIPLVAIALFLLVWSRLSAGIETSLGQIPGPMAVVAQTQALWADHLAEREKRAAFYERQKQRNAERLKEDPTATDRRAQVHGQAHLHRPDLHEPRKRCSPASCSQRCSRCRSGILCGLSKTVNSALNPFIQLFKPVSPLAWLPIVTLLVSALYASDNPMFEKSFVNSAITVTLCSLWPTVINTALGVGSIDRDLMNVARVLQPRRLHAPLQAGAARLAAADLHRPAPVAGGGLDGAHRLRDAAPRTPASENSSGTSSRTAARTRSRESWWRCSPIGFVGFLLDRVMYGLQSLFTFGARR